MRRLTSGESRARRENTGVLWHRRRGENVWRRLGTYPSVARAVEMMLAAQAEGTTGDWYAGRATEVPSAAAARTWATT